MTPYYQDGFVTIYHGDCRDVLPIVSPVDLIVTDPPYGVGYDYGDGTDDSPERHWPWMLDTLEIMRAASPQVVFTHRQDALFRLPRPDKVCVWHKPFALGYAIRGWMAHWEPIFVYGADVTLRNNAGKKAASCDSFSFSTVPNRHGHPAEKPLEFMQALIGVFSGNVCDPFMGSGTTLVGAKNLGRKAIGIEIDERYCEIAAKRCSQEVLRL